MINSSSAKTSVEDRFRIRRNLNFTRMPLVSLCVAGRARARCRNPPAPRVSLACACSQVVRVLHRWQHRCKRRFHRRRKLDGPRRASCLPLPLRCNRSGSRLTQWETRPPGKYPLMPAKLPHSRTSLCLSPPSAPFPVLSRHFHPPFLPFHLYRSLFPFTVFRSILLSPFLPLPYMHTHALFLSPPSLSVSLSFSLSLLLSASSLLYIAFLAFSSFITFPSFPF